MGKSAVLPRARRAPPQARRNGSTPPGTPISDPENHQKIDQKLSSPKKVTQSGHWVPMGSPRGPKGAKMESKKHPKIVSEGVSVEKGRISILYGIYHTFSTFTSPQNDTFGALLPPGASSKARRLKSAEKMPSGKRRGRQCAQNDPQRDPPKEPKMRQMQRFSSL